MLKQKRNENDEESEKKDKNEHEQRGPDINEQCHVIETTAIQKFDNYLWLTFVTKAFDSERDKKRYKENEQASRIATKVICVPKINNAE